MRTELGEGNTHPASLGLGQEVWDGREAGAGSRLGSDVGCSSTTVTVAHELEVKLNLFIICPPQNLGEATPHSICF